VKKRDFGTVGKGKAAGGGTSSANTELGWRTALSEHVCTTVLQYDTRQERACDATHHRNIERPPARRAVIAPRLRKTSYRYNNPQ
jgi:hypothetical protein